MDEYTDICERTRARVVARTFFFNFVSRLFFFLEGGLSWVTTQIGTFLVSVEVVQRWSW